MEVFRDEVPSMKYEYLLEQMAAACAGGMTLKHAGASGVRQNRNFGRYDSSLRIWRCNSKHAFQPLELRHSTPPNNFSAFTPPSLTPYPVYYSFGPLTATQAKPHPRLL